MKLTGERDDLGAALESLRRAPAAPGAPAGRRPWWAAVLVAGVVVAGVGWWVTHRTASAPAAAASAPVAVAPARGASVDCTGYVEESERAKVSASVLGRIAAVRVREGDVVKRGDALVDLDTSELEASLAATRARASAQRARVDVASLSEAESRGQAERERRLVALGAAPQAPLDDADAHLRVLGASVVAARADAIAVQSEAAVLEKRIALHHLAAPFDGTVITRPLAVGDVASPGVPVLELAGALEIVADVPEARTSLVTIGAPATITLDAIPGELAARVVGFGSRIDKAKATGAVKLQLARGDVALRIGMSAHVRIDAKAKEER